MKPAPFEYHRAYSAEEASALLGKLGDEAKIIAGGQSLVPMMNFRLAHPTALVDINTIGGLDYIRRDGDTLRIGALTKHRTVEVTSSSGVLDGFGLLPRAARWIGHYPIRTRGTMGGSLAHADATAEWCLLASLFDADISVESAHRGRSIAVSDWFQGYLVNGAEPDEVVTEICFNRPRTHGAITEFARRKGDFAIIAVGVAFNVVDDVLIDVGIVIGGVGGQPLRVASAEALAEGQPSSADLISAVAEESVRAAEVGPYESHLIRTLVRRAFDEARTASSTTKRRRHDGE